MFAHYWRSLCDEGPVPHRRRFDPMKVVSLLPCIALYDVVSKNEIICRLAGTELVERFGFELTGMNFLDIWQLEGREETGAIMNAMVTTPCGLIVELAGTSESGQVSKSLAVGFPLLDGEGECNRLVFYSTGFDPKDARIAREDKIRSVTVNRSSLIDITS